MAAAVAEASPSVMNNRFHPDQAEGHVGCGDARGHEQILALSGFGNQRTVGDRIGLGHIHSEPAFECHFTVFDKALRFVGVDGIGRQPHGVGRHG